MKQMKTLTINNDDNAFEIVDDESRRSLQAILDPDMYPLSGEEDKITNIALEIGGLSTNTGEERERNDAVRAVEFLPVTAGKKVYITNSLTSLDKLRVILYDTNKAYVKVIYPEIAEEFTIDANVAYLRFYRSDTTDTSMIATLVEKGGSTKAEIKKIYFAEHGYEIYGANIDSETMHKLSIYASGKDGNEYNITEIKAPKSNPAEATLCLMNSGNGITQFVDFSSMTYGGKRKVEIVNQCRGENTLPEFSIRYNDGKGAGRVKKLTVQPDCIPLELTATGLKVRKTNDYNNDGTEDDFITVNFVDWLSRIEALETKIQALETRIQALENASSTTTDTETETGTTDTTTNTETETGV